MRTSPDAKPVTSMTRARPRFVTAGTEQRKDREDTTRNRRATAQARRASLLLLDLGGERVHVVERRLEDHLILDVLRRVVAPDDDPVLHLAPFHRGELGYRGSLEQFGDHLLGDFDRGAVTEDAGEHLAVDVVRGHPESLAGLYLRVVQEESIERLFDVGVERELLGHVSSIPFLGEAEDLLAVPRHAYPCRA